MYTKFNDYAMKFLLPIVSVLIILLPFSLLIGNTNLTIGLAVLIIIACLFGLTLGRE